LTSAAVRPHSSNGCGAVVIPVREEEEEEKGEGYLS